MSADNIILKARLPKMSGLERKVYDLFAEASPQSLYNLGLEQYADKFMILSRQNIQLTLRKLASLKRKCTSRDDVIRKLIDSLEIGYQWDEPGPFVGVVVDVLSSHLIKEGIRPERLKTLIVLLSQSVEASLQFLSTKRYPVPVKILAQYQLFSAYEVVDLIIRESTDTELIEKTRKLKNQLVRFAERFSVSGFTDGEFSQVVRIMKSQGVDLRREKFYPLALRRGFDYKESPAELERKALRWIREDLPKLRKATRELAELLHCNNDPESVDKQLKSRPGVAGKGALKATKDMRSIIQAFVEESIVGFNPVYSTEVLETPKYLSAIIPTAAAQGFDALTEKPSQRYYLTTDPKRAPPGGFADLVNTLVHEEYGHCLHFSNTAAEYRARASIGELLPSLHTGASSEGLAFQRELEFLDSLERLSKKKQDKYTEAERNYVKLTERYGGFRQTLLELRFITYKQRIIRFLRVVGDVRINSGKQNLLEFLKWAEKRTGLAERTVFYQIFPAHEGIFPGYATCYAVVGQDIREIQKPFKDDAKKMVEFNAYACSMGYPARSIYTKRLKKYAKELMSSSAKK